MRVCYLSLFLVFFSTVASAYQKPGFTVERSPDGRYLRLMSKVMTSSSKGTARDLTIYDFQTGTVTTQKQVSAYGGHSPNHQFLAYSQHSKARNKHVYKNERIALATNRKTTFSDDHLVLKVFDDGKILSTKPGFDKYGNVKSQSGLFVFDPATGKKSVTISKKEDMRAYFRGIQVFTDDLHYAYKLKGDLEVFDLQKGAVQKYKIPWPDLGFYGNRRLLEAGGEVAILRVSGTKDGQRQWYDYHFDTQTKVLTQIGDHTKSGMEPVYELIDGQLLTINPAEKSVQKLSVNEQDVSEIASMAFSSADYRREIDEYHFALASEDKLAIIHFNDGLMQLIDLASDQQIAEVRLFTTKPSATALSAKKTAAAQPRKKLYNNVFLDSFDPLPLAYQLDYNTIRGRATQRPNGQAVSAIGLLGNTTQGHLIVLMMRRYNAQGAEVIRFQVAVYDDQAKLMAEKEVGFTSKDSSGVPNRVDFVISRKGSDILFDVGQKEGRANREHKVTIDQNGRITKTGQ